MENRFKRRISRMFRSSFGSCRTRNIPDVIEKAVFSPENHRSFHLVRPPLWTSSPKTARPFPTICKPRCPESTQGAINNDCIMIAPRETLPRRKVSARYPPFHVSSGTAGYYFDGRKCTPASPISPLSIFAECKDFGFYEKNKSLNRTKKKKKNKKVHVKSKNMSSSTTAFFSSSSHESISNYNHGGWWWFSSEDETETFFSSRTLTSDSSESHWERFYNVDRRKLNNCRSNACVIGILPLDGTSFAVVKSSRDPYKDFRTSMVEMIIERQIFAAKDLEQLLQCFLSLNSHHHHNIIVKVFTEIWETIFSNWS